MYMIELDDVIFTTSVYHSKKQSGKKYAQQSIVMKRAFEERRNMTPLLFTNKTNKID